MPKLGTKPASCQKILTRIILYDRSSIQITSQLASCPLQHVACRVRSAPHSVLHDLFTMTLFPSLSRTSFISLLAAASLTASGAEPLYQNNFEEASVGPSPKELMVISGVFTVAAEAGNKFLELPGAPLDAFGALFGANPPGDATASARFHGTKKGRKFPTFGISLHGVGGYRLQVSPAKNALELYKGDELRQSVPFTWQSGTWTHLRIQLRKSDGGCTVEGKTWTEGTPEPSAWAVTLQEKEVPAPGRAGIWGSPYAGTPIRFDDLRLAPAE